MCTWFSVLQAMNRGRMKKEDWEESYHKAVEHLKFVFEMYEEQLLSGRYFLHDHPAAATSWRLPHVVAFCSRYPHLYAVSAALCQFGLTTPGENGKEDPAQKLTRFLTNSPYLAATLDRSCPGDHSHTALLNGRAKAAQVYPPAWCSATVSGFAEQLKADTELLCLDLLVKSPVPVFNLELLGGCRGCERRRLDRRG